MSKNLLKAWHRFMQTSFNSFKGAPSDLHKTRKYEHIEIQKDFEEIEKKRHLQRLTLIEYKKKLRKQLLEQQLDAAKTQAPELLADKELAEELKHAQDMKKYSEHKTFQDFTKNLEDSKRQLTEQKAAATAAASAQELQKELAKISADIDKIRSTKQELEKVEQEIEELEPNYVLVSGIEKKLVLNAITYYEFQHRNLQGVLINPETIKALETVHYHVEHNLPVRRELLYEVVPELFEVEIGELDQYERERILAKRPRLQHSADAIIRAVEDPPEERKNLEDFEEYKKQEMDFMEFVYAKAREFIHIHHDHIENKMSLGFPTTESVLENIEGKPAEERSEEEKALYDDLQEIKVLNNDYAELIKLNKAKIFAKQRELYVPDFVKQNERLHSMWVEKWEQLVASSFEFSESLFLPDNSRSFESQLDKVLKQQQAQDINELISQSQEEYKTRVGAKEATRSIDRNVKNMQLLQKLDVMTGAMHQVEERKKVKQRELDHFQTTLGQAETPEEGRILLDELTKVLFLNNRDPKSYNLIFWAEHFNIEPQKLRNIFNFVTFGLPDRNNPKDIGRVLRFIYDNSALTDEQKQQLA